MSAKATADVPDTAPAAKPPPAEASTPAPPWGGVAVVMDRINENTARLRVTFTSGTALHAARAAAEAIAWRAFDAEIQRHLSVSEPIRKWGLARAQEAQAQKEMAAVSRKAERAVLDRADALDGLTGEKLTRALGRADAEKKAALQRVEDSKCGLQVLAEHAAQARAAAWLDVTRIDALAVEAVAKQLHARKLALMTTLAAGNALDELLAAVVATDLLPQRADRTDRAARLLADAAGAAGAAEWPE